MNIKELKEDEEKYKIEKAQQEEEYRTYYEKLRAKLLAEHTIRAEKMLDAELGELIKSVNRKGHKGIKLDAYCCCYLSGIEKHGEKFQLGFEPNPDYTPTKILIKILKDAGFGAEIFTNTTGDDYAFRDAPGTHLEHHLIITWE